MPAPLPADPRVDQILEVIARETRIDRIRSKLDVPADQLGMSPLELALALLEIEDRFDLDPVEGRPDAPAPTVKELVLRALAAMDQRNAALR